MSLSNSEILNKEEKSKNLSLLSFFLSKIFSIMLEHDSSNKYPSSLPSIKDLVFNLKKLLISIRLVSILNVSFKRNNFINAKL